MGSSLQAGLELLVVGLATVFMVLVLLMLVIKGMKLAVDAAGRHRPGGNGSPEEAAIIAAVLNVVLAGPETSARPLPGKETQEEK